MKIQSVSNWSEMQQLITEAEALIDKYGWQDRYVWLYDGSCRVKAGKIMKDCKDYKRCTRGSQAYLHGLATRFIKILNSWEQYELSPKCKVRIVATGKIVEITVEMADILGELAERV